MKEACSTLHAIIALSGFVFVCLAESCCVLSLLQECSTTAKHDIVRCEASLLQALENLWNCFIVDAVTLDDTNVWWQQFVSRLCCDDVLRELLQQDPNDLCAGLSRVTAVGSHNKTAKLVATDAALDQVLQLRAPIILAGAPNVKGVAHASDKAVWVLLQHVLHRIHLALNTPRGDCRVLGSRDRVARRDTSAVVGPST